ncbi:MAG TPA: NAD(P)H-binding protein [Vicinamibacterales bacterium]|nr:NAD(P)H-binding protein [Vicinamibacterales bacterium]
MIAIMGATGHTGRAIAEILLGQGEKVRALSRAEKHLASLTQRGAEPALGNASDRAYLVNAFRGADAVYVLIPPNLTAPDFRAYQDKIGETTTAALAESGVRYVVFLSSIGAQLPEGSGPIVGLHRQEERLRKMSGLNVLALRPSYFFENHFATLGLIKAQGIDGGAVAPDLAFPQIATRDIALVAADALRKRDFTGFTVRELMGPRDLTMREAARILGQKIGKPELSYVQFPYADFAQSLEQMGLSASLAQDYAEMARGFNEGRVKPTQPRGEQTTTPTQFEDFAEELATAYRGM